MHIAINLNLFKLISQPITIPEIAQTTHADPVLLIRLLRVLSSHFYVQELSCGTSTSTRLSIVMRCPPMRDRIKIAFDMSTIDAELPQYLASPDYRNPEDHEHSSANFGLRDEYSPRLRKKHPQNLAGFNWVMKNPGSRAADVGAGVPV